MATNTSRGLVKPVYGDTADIAVINSNMEKIDTMVTNADKAIAIISDGDTHTAINNGQYVYVFNHNTMENVLTEGLYINNSGSNIAANGSLSTSNLTAVDRGIMNHYLQSIPYKTITKTCSAAARANLNFASPGQHLIVITTTGDVCFIMTVAVASNMSTIAYAHSGKNISIYEMGVTPGKMTIQADQASRVLNILDFRISGDGFVS